MGTSDLPSNATVAIATGHDHNHDGKNDDVGASLLARCLKQPRYHPDLGLARRIGVEGVVATAIHDNDDDDMAWHRQ
jgi:hypothetical protein